MRVISCIFDTISVEKKKELGKDATVNTDMKILDIKPASFEMFNNNSLSVNFQFKINYKPDYANLLFEGKLIILMDENEDKFMESVLDNWKKKIVIEDFQIPLLQIIFSKCCVKALLLEEFVNLPTHIQTVPKISKDKENKFKDKEKNSKE